MQLVPGGPFSSDAGGRPRAPEIQARLEAEYGLDRPPVEQYITYMKRLVFEFDFGPSMRQIDFTTNQLLFGLDFWAHPLKSPVLISAQLGVFSFVLAVIIGIPMGIVSALFRNKAPDHAAMFITTLGISVPNFVLGLLLILLFSLTLHWLPVYGWGKSWKQMVMPIITLGTGGMALIARLTRASVLETLGQDYIRTPREGIEGALCADAPCTSQFSYPCGHRIRSIAGGLAHGNILRRAYFRDPWNWEVLHYSSY